jgi:hypothetical protein
MKKKYLVSAGWYTNLVFDNIKCASAAFELLCGQCINKEYIGGRYVAVEKKGEEPTLTAIDCLTQEEYDAEVKAEKEKDAAEKAAKEEAQKADENAPKVTEPEEP